jgi:hypothetical protein
MDQSDAHTIFINLTYQRYQENYDKLHNVLYNIVLKSVINIVQLWIILSISSKGAEQEEASARHQKVQPLPSMGLQLMY